MSFFPSSFLSQIFLSSPSILTRVVSVPWQSDYMDWHFFPQCPDATLRWAGNLLTGTAEEEHRLALRVIFEILKLNTPPNALFSSENGSDCDGGGSAFNFVQESAGVTQSGGWFAQHFLLNSQSHTLGAKVLTYMKELQDLQTSAPQLLDWGPKDIPNNKTPVTLCQLGNLRIKPNETRLCVFTSLTQVLRQIYGYW